MRKFRTYHEVEHDTSSRIGEQVVEQRDRVRRRLASVHALVAVASGKGGVGKSAITANLAVALAQRGARVGALDADLNGPSLGRMLGVSGARLQEDVNGVWPAMSRDAVRVMSMDLLQIDEAPLKWRGPRADTFIWRSTAEYGTLREFLGDVAWGELDYLLIDVPPGTDRIQRLLDLVPDPHQVLLVTTPSEITRFVVTKTAQLLKQAAVGCCGIVANMTGGERGEPGSDSVRILSAETGLPLWAEIAFEPELSVKTDRGLPYVTSGPASSPAVQAILHLAGRVEHERGGRLA